MIETASTSIRRFYRRHGLFGLGLSVWIVLAAYAFAANSGMERAPDEYDVKAAYLYYFAKFVEWPDNKFSASNSSVIIGIAGDDSLGRILETTVSGKTVQNHNLVIYHPKTLEDLQSCHILFISSPEASRIASSLESLESNHVLTVCERESKTDSKCIINFVMEKGRVQFEIDDKKAAKSGLKISSKLMMVARVPPSDAVKRRN